MSLLGMRLDKLKNFVACRNDMDWARAILTGFAEYCLLLMMPHDKTIQNSEGDLQGEALTRLGIVYLSPGCLFRVNRAAL